VNSAPSQLNRSRFPLPKSEVGRWAALPKAPDEAPLQAACSSVRRGSCRRIVRAPRGGPCRKTALSLAMLDAPDRRKTSSHPALFSTNPRPAPDYPTPRFGRRFRVPGKGRPIADRRIRRCRTRRGATWIIFYSDKRRSRLWRAVASGAGARHEGRCRLLPLDRDIGGVGHQVGPHRRFHAQLAPQMARQSQRHGGDG
jgi:hypothetical protein